jgi:hypothetical protein
MRQDEIATWLRLARADVRNELDRRITEWEEWLTLSARRIDDVERTIDDIRDQRLRRDLRVTVDLLDEYHGMVLRAVSDIASHEVWDPLRVLEVDLRSELSRGSNV